MRKLLDLPPPPDGVACHNDPVAAEAMRAILDAGLRIPDDISVMGVGNIHYSDFFRVPMSTIDQDSILTGRRAGELLLRLNGLVIGLKQAGFPGGRYGSRGWICGQRW